MLLQQFSVTCACHAELLWQHPLSLGCHSALLLLAVAAAGCCPCAATGCSKLSPGAARSSSSGMQASCMATAGQMRDSSWPSRCAKRKQQLRAWQACSSTSQQDACRHAQHAQDGHVADASSHCCLGGRVGKPPTAAQQWAANSNVSRWPDLLCCDPWKRQQ